MYVYVGCCIIVCRALSVAFVVSPEIHRTTRNVSCFSPIFIMFYAKTHTMWRKGNDLFFSLSFCFSYPCRYFRAIIQLFASLSICFKCKCSSVYHNVDFEPGASTLRVLLYYTEYFLPWLIFTTIMPSPCLHVYATMFLIEPSTD